MSLCVIFFIYCIGMLFQQGVLIDTLNVEENIMLSLMSAGYSSDILEVKKCVENVGLHIEDLKKMPNELSGGMLRRAALAQLLAQKKKLIVLDEPFTGLDPCTANGIVKELIRLKKVGTSFILISHLEQYANQLEPVQSIDIIPFHKQRRSKTTNKCMSCFRHFNNRTCDV